MRSIPFTGSLPVTLAENARPQGWAGSLMLGIDPALVSFIDVIGTADLYLDSSFDRTTGRLQLWNIATPDYEAFSRVGASPLVQFQVRVFMADGTQGLSSETYSLEIGQVDDTPPSALTFATGGTVAPGDVGAVIGTLAVTDADSVGPFTFKVGALDAWQYEVVGDTLKLKQGMTVAISDGPYRALQIEVSDGSQSAGFRLDMRVEWPAGGVRSVLDVLDPWETKAGFSWKDADTVWALRGGWELERIEFHDNDLLNIVMAGGEQVWLPTVGKLEFLNGTLDMRVGSPAEQVASIYQAVLGRLPDREGLANSIRMIETGAVDKNGLVTVLLESDEFSSRHGGSGNEDFVRMLYRNTEGGTPYEVGVSGWTGALNNGASRQTVARAFVDWEVNLSNLRELHPNGWWVERQYGTQVAAMYAVALERLPDRDGYEYWMGELAAGRIGPINLSVLFGRSPEFLNKFEKETNEFFVDALYHSALGREPDQEGFDFWTGHLNSGALGRDLMIYYFGFSVEKQSALEALPMGEPFFS